VAGLNIFEIFAGKRPAVQGGKEKATPAMTNPAIVMAGLNKVLYFLFIHLFFSFFSCIPIEYRLICTMAGEKSRLIKEITEISDVSRKSARFQSQEACERLGALRLYGEHRMLIVRFFSTKPRCSSIKPIERAPFAFAFLTGSRGSSSSVIAAVLFFFWGLRYRNK